MYFLFTVTCQPHSFQTSKPVEITLGNNLVMKVQCFMPLPLKYQANETIKPFLKVY